MFHLRAPSPIGVLVGLLVLLSPMGAGPAGAQPRSTTTETPTVSSAQDGIPVSQITVEAEKARGRIAQLRLEARPDPEVEKLTAELDAIQPTLQSELQTTRNRLAEGLSFRELEDHAKRWRRTGERIQGWLDSSGEKAAALDQALAELQDLRHLWSATPTEDQIALQNVVDEILALIGAAEGELGEARTRLTLLRSPLREAANEVQEILRAIEGEHRARSVELARPDSPRLWEHPGWKQGAADLTAHLSQNLHYLKLDLQEFISDSGQRLFEQLLVIVVLALVIFLLRRRMAASEIAPESLSLHSRILENPISTAFLVGVAFSNRLYPQAPPVVSDLAAILLFFPYLRVLPETVLRGARGFLTGVWILLVLGRIEGLFPTDSLIIRLLMLIEATVGLVIFLAALRQRPGETRFLSGRVASVTMLILRLSIVAFAVSLPANLLGYAHLSRLLNTTTIDGAYAAILLFGLFLATRGLIQLLPHAFLLRRSRMLQRHAPLIQRRLTTAVRWLLILWLVSVYLREMRIMDAVLEGIRRVLSAAARFGDLEISLGGILAFFLTLYVASLVSRFLRFVLEEDVYYRVYLPRGVPYAISTSLHYVILALGFILAVAATGVELNQLTILLGAFGVGIGFGLQDIVRNFVSGAVLLFERPIMPGDTIQTPQLWGEVKRIGIRSSTVRTWEGAEVIVPNSDLVMSQVTNWTLSDRQRRMEILVGVAYGSDPAAVVDLLVEVARANEDLLETPPPQALFLGFGESSLDFSLRAWTVKFEDYLRIKSRLTIAVHDALKTAGYEIPFPQRDLHLRSVPGPASHGVDGGTGVPGYGERGPSAPPGGGPEREDGSGA